MKKVLAIVVLLVIVTAGMAWASATNWMFYIEVSQPDGTDAGLYNQMGVKPASTDGVDSSYDPEYDLTSAGGSEKVAVQKIGSITDTVYQRNYLATYDLTTTSKTWSYRVAGLVGASTATGIKMLFKTNASTNLAAPVGSYYSLKLVNARGQTITKPAFAGGGTWAEGVVLTLTVPSTANTYFINQEVDLPAIKLAGGNTPQNMLSQGYEFEFSAGTVGTVPEPASLLALSAGLIGLAGIIKRRKA